MPHLTLPLRGSKFCPVIDVHVGPSKMYVDALKHLNKPVPNPIKLEAMIDTGADCTCIDVRILKGSLGLHSRSQHRVHTASGDPIVLPEYDIALDLIHSTSNRSFESIPVLGADFTNDEVQYLIGRDVLNHCLFIYDGGAKSLCLAF